MKKGILILLFVMGIGLLHAQTTMEEYNYITKEYKQDKASGTVKAGYTLEDVNTIVYVSASSDRTFNFKKLMRAGSGQVAAVIVEYVRATGSGEQTYYFCIPTEKSSDGVWKDVQDTIESLGSSELRNAYIWALTKYVSATL